MGSRVGGLILLALLGAGCSATNLSEVIKAMAESKRSYCFRESSIYTNIQLSATGIENGSARCTSDGIVVETVKAEAAQPSWVPPPQPMGGRR